MPRSQCHALPELDEVFQRGDDKRQLALMGVSLDLHQLNSIRCLSEGDCIKGSFEYKQLPISTAGKIKCQETGTLSRRTLSELLTVTLLIG